MLINKVKQINIENLYRLYWCVSRPILFLTEKSSLMFYNISYILKECFQPILNGLKS